MTPWLMSLSPANVALLILTCWLLLVVGFVKWRELSAMLVRRRVTRTASTFCRNQQGRPHEPA